ncbi:hypothetical protein [Falsiroseomonas oryziterrae]|uniref:hypothetical protein n=1 Tax=Falsiroseomonas oryziterrae TaxID=2911368 RepID=UPI001F41EC9D|nr:hypothetical protein [Roseomonas sp. NPKOSM-4]
MDPYENLRIDLQAALRSVKGKIAAAGRHGNSDADVRLKRQRLLDAWNILFPGEARHLP